MYSLDDRDKDLYAGVGGTDPREWEGDYDLDDQEGWDEDDFIQTDDEIEAEIDDWLDAWED